MTKKPDLSIVIGSYNNRDLTASLIKSIYKYSKDVSLEIILIDDNSPDDISEYTKKNFLEVRLYRNKKNLGYSKTYNKGSKLSRGRYILHMNADMLFTNKTLLSEVLKYMDSHDDVGMLGDEVLDYYTHKLDPDNRHQIPTLANSIGQSLGLYKLFPRVKSLNYYMTYLGEDETAEVGGIGGFMLFRRKVLTDVGYLDEKFKIYCQDSDFCYRTIKRGWKIIYYPASESIHLGGGTVKRFSVKNQIIFHQDLWRYYKKNLIKKYPFFVKYIIFVGLVLRFFVFTAFEIIKHLISSFRNKK